eukprot:153893-Lingulodinium_polyedra.AAC.1
MLATIQFNVAPRLHRSLRIPEGLLPRLHQKQHGALGVLNGREEPVPSLMVTNLLGQLHEASALLIRFPSPDPT